MPDPSIGFKPAPWRLTDTHFTASFLLARNAHRDAAVRWYTRLMRFQCQSGCIRCCEQKGHVYLTPDDIARLAAHTCLSRAEFQRKYLCGTAPLLRFRKPRGKQCAFLTDAGCSVHSIKPQQCRSFPYWPEILDKPSERKEIAAYCPGLGRGPLVNLTVARREANRLLKAFPQLYQPEEDGG